MKRKLTLTIDENLVPQVKRIAILKEVSVSELVEKNMRDLVEEEQPTFSEKWRGKFATTAAKVTSKENPRYDYLAKKYL